MLCVWTNRPSSGWQGKPSIKAGRQALIRQAGRLSSDRQAGQAVYIGRQAGFGKLTSERALQAGSSQGAERGVGVGTRPRLHGHCDAL